MKKYFIKDEYISRLEPTEFDDTGLTDEWQKEVYQFAEDIFKKNNFNSVLDIGTGSGYKLIKHFDQYNTLGIDIPKTVEFLKKTYPTKNWSDKFSPIQGYDLIISSDVIEHIPDPDTLLDLISSCKPKLIILSTPDRDSMDSDRIISKNGPPKNPSHVREWNFQEFYNYISSRFEVIEHFISNKKQVTQVILCKPNYEHKEEKDN